MTASDAPAAAPVIHPWHGWLTAVLPASARRFRVRDHELATTLRAAGAELVEDDPDVEIATGAEIEGEAPMAVLDVRAAGAAGDRLAIRAARRALGSARVQARARCAARSLRSRGYRDVHVALWDIERRPAPAPGIAGVAALPLGALVFGRRGATGEPTALDVAISAAESATGISVRGHRLLLGSGLALAIGKAGVLRVAFGPAAREFEAQELALDSLRAARPRLAVAERVPWVRGRGRIGLADWSLERRLPGLAPRRGLADATLDDCVAFLAALFELESGAERQPSARANANLLSELYPAGQAERLCELGAWADAAVEGLPRGFGHGDLWPRNVLLQGDRLRGVVDWSSAGPGRLPLLDLLHLIVNSRRLRARRGWLAEVIRDSLSGTRLHADPHIRSYTSRLGLTLEREQFQALAVTYCLDVVARRVRLYGLPPDGMDAGGEILRALLHARSPAARAA